jgi:hypothetical protein
MLVDHAGAVVGECRARNVVRSFEERLFLRDGAIANRGGVERLEDVARTGDEPLAERRFRRAKRLRDHRHVGAADLEQAMAAACAAEAAFEMPTEALADRVEVVVGALQNSPVRVAHPVGKPRGCALRSLG